MLLLEIQHGSTILLFSYKIKHMLILQPAILLLGISPKRNKNTGLQRGICMNVHRSFIQNIIISERGDTQMVIYFTIQLYDSLAKSKSIGK